jgi:hydrogenase expression/formation protein HypD
MIHGPGCPVCVTPLEQIDKALVIAARPDVIFTSYGDMLRVPGSTTDLLSLKARGADVRIVYSPLDAVRIAAANPDRQVVFFAIGFETTAPANAMAVWQAARLGLDNFTVLVSHVLVPPAMCAILESPTCQVQAFLAAGHVCAVMGWTEYEPIAERYHVPIVVTGFEPLDLLEGILMAIRQLESGRAEVENQYARAVKREGNLQAQEDGLPRLRHRRPKVARHRHDPGIRLSPAARVRAFDAEARFDVGTIHTRSTRPASPARSCRGRRRRSTVRPTACSARRRSRSGHRWSAAKASAPPTMPRGVDLPLPGRCRCSS